MAIKINGTEIIDDSRNIVNVGNIDGRDVSVDGSKLDNIEGNADVTDSDNVGSALTGFTTETSIAETDLIPVYDASASSWRKATVSDAALVGTKGQKGEVGAAGSNGSNGAKGQKGQTGLTGNKGQKGEIGDQGIQGDTGSKGQKGELGLTGGTGLTGDAGAKGQKGEVGGQGLTGDKGQKGQAGADGTNGSNGSIGLTGDTGQKGQKGEVGLTGGSGSKGQKGEIGAGGQKGQSGSQGDQGIQGDTGSKGQKGEVGQKGQTGGTGLTGGTGQKGDKGQKGELGGTGLTGGTGQKGQKGQTGNTGNTGASGTQGVQGVQGVQGSKGQKGATGTAGTNGSNGQKGQKGEAGAAGGSGQKGQKGEKGQKGQTGLTGGNGQKGEKGQKGQTGAKGQKGQTGNTGGTGQKGQKGQTGSTGLTGNTGGTGAKGQKGEVGATGQKGQTGATGATGQKGQKGQTGATGTSGGTGATGAKGQKGQKGDNGTTGATGLIDSPYGALAAYGSSVQSNITWSNSEQAMSLRSSSDTSIGAAFPAFRVNLSSAETHKLSIKYKGSAATSNGFYVRVYEYNAALPAGKLAVSNSATNALVQEDTSGKTNWKENQSVTTSWQTTDYTYTPTAGAVWASIVILNWTGIGTNHLYIRDPEHQLIGSSGQKGQKGQTGSTGSTGQKGQKGQTGATGSTGSTGSTGAKGQKGDEAGNAGLLDGIDSSQFVRSDVSDTASNLTINTLTIGSSAKINFQNNDSMSYDDADGVGAFKFNADAGSENAKVKAGEVHASSDMYVGDQIIHVGDTDTYMQFDAANSWRVVTGGTEKLSSQSNGITITSPTGNASFGSSNSSWFHMSTDRPSFYMAQGLAVNGKLGVYNQNTYLISDDMYLNGIIYHYGDTNTYMQFHAADQWRVVTGGSERLEVNNSQVTSTEPIHAPSFHGSGSSLTGLMPTSGGTFTGNVTFNDSNELNFGTGGDFQIAFNGTDTYFSNNANADGDVFFGGNVSNGTYMNAMKLDFSGTSNYVILYSGNQEVFRTRSGGIDVSSHIYIDGNIYHNGDTNTYIGFHAADQWRVVTGGTERLEVNSNTMTVAATLSMNGHSIDMNNNDIVGVDQIVHEGDSDTYIRFHAADQFQVVTGGTERLEVNNSQITSAEPIHAPSFHGDGSALTNIPGPSTTAGAVGTYAYLIATTSSIGITPGTNYAGSGLRYSAQSSNSITSSSGYSVGHNQGTAPAGTWRAMGGRTATGTYKYAATLYVRVS